MYNGTCCIVYIIRFTGCSQRYIFSVLIFHYVCARFTCAHVLFFITHLLSALFSYQCAAPFYHLFRRLNVGYVRLCRPRGSGESVPALSVFIMLSLESKSFSVLLKVVTAKICENLSLCFFPKRKKALGRAHGVKKAPVSEHRDSGL